MTVYVDDSAQPVGTFAMARMFADTDKELQATARRIGLSQTWRFESPTGAGIYYQVSPGLRAQAMRRVRGVDGAQQVTAQQAAAMLTRRRLTGDLGTPAEAIEWLRARREQQPQQAPATQERPE